MPELPEVEVLVRHLAPRLTGRTIQGIQVGRPRSLRPGSVARFVRALEGARFLGVIRRGKYLVFTLQPADGGASFRMLGHLGMTGRMFVQQAGEVSPRHLVARFELEDGLLTFEDTRYFGRLTLDAAVLEPLGPEPFDDAFTAKRLHEGLKRSKQAVKVRLLDQSLIAGVGNIYACEALFTAGLSPRRRAHRVTLVEAERLHRAIREVLKGAIDLGSSLSLSLERRDGANRIFYFGASEDPENSSTERFRVYDRMGEACRVCGRAIRRCVQMGRSSYYCQACQH